jgi:hypothetical protein
VNRLTAAAAEFVDCAHKFQAIQCEEHFHCGVCDRAEAEDEVLETREWYRVS